MSRFLLLFAREPSREARSKGFATAGAEDLFAGFARGWIDTASRLGARLVIATPIEDLAAWRRRLGGGGAVDWIVQRGESFGERLRRAARDPSLAEGRVVVVGGDVPPDPESARRAFEALEAGADAVLSPSPDGGVSLLGLTPEDDDLLARMTIGCRTVFASLASALAARGRRCVLLRPSADVDDRAGLRRLRRRPRVPAGDGPVSPPIPVSVLRAALSRPFLKSEPAARIPRDQRLSGPSGLRAPPRAA